MKFTFATAISSALIAAAIPLAGPALAAPGANPSVPIGPNPVVPGQPGYYDPNVSDDAGTANPVGGVNPAF